MLFALKSQGSPWTRFDHLSFHFRFVLHTSGSHYYDLSAFYPDAALGHHQTNMRGISLPQALVGPMVP
jgi:hypothetical protein